MSAVGDMLAKARRVLTPGSRGGKWYRTKTGEVRYGAQPTPRDPYDRYLAAKPAPAGISYRNEVTDAYSGQTNGRMSATVGDQVVAHLDWQSFRGATLIAYVEVDPEWRRKGIGRELVARVQAELGEPIEWGYMTPDGTALRESMRGTIEEAKPFNPADRFPELEDEPEPADTRTPFQKWFGNSKVVDRYGKPLVVYHGAPDARGIHAEGFKERTRGKVWFASDSHRVARSYADDRRAFDYQGAEPEVIPLYLSIQNPMVIDSTGQRWRETEKHIEAARAAGHDGVIIRNSLDFYDENGKRGRTKTSTVYAWFEPTQAKSPQSAGFDPTSALLAKADVQEPGKIKRGRNRLGVDRRGRIHWRKPPPEQHGFDFTAKPKEPEPEPPPPPPPVPEPAPPPPPPEPAPPLAEEPTKAPAGKAALDYAEVKRIILDELPRAYESAFQAFGQHYARDVWEKTVLPPLPVKLSTRVHTRVAGYVRVKNGKPVFIRFPLNTLSLHDEEGIRNTVGHEVAHYVTMVVHDGQCQCTPCVLDRARRRKQAYHGEQFTGTMRAMGYDPGHRTIIDPSQLPNQVPFHCACRTHWYGKRKAANMMVKMEKFARRERGGGTWSCRQCHKTLVPGALPDDLVAKAGDVLEPGKISRRAGNVLGVDKRGRLHWRRNAPPENEAGQGDLFAPKPKAPPPPYTLRKRPSGDGVRHDIFVGAKKVGSIGGFERDTFFDLWKTELREYRGTGLYQLALQQVADQYPEGVRSLAWQSSSDFKRAVRKLPTFEALGDGLWVRPTKPAASVDAHADYQEHGTKSAAFLRWFGDWIHDPASASKVVNEKGEPAENAPTDGRTGSLVTGPEGEPLVVYHGSPHHFTAFDPQTAKPGLYGTGFYFTQDRLVAEGEFEDTDEQHFYDTREEAEAAPGRVGFVWENKYDRPQSFGDTPSDLKYHGLRVREWERTSGPTGKWIARLPARKVVHRGYARPEPVPEMLAPEGGAIRQKFISAVTLDLEERGPHYLTQGETDFVRDRLQEFFRQPDLHYLEAAISGQPYNLDVYKIAEKAGVVTEGETYRVFLNIRRPLKIDELVHAPWSMEMKSGVTSSGYLKTEPYMYRGDEWADVRRRLLDTAKHFVKRGDVWLHVEEAGPTDATIFEAVKYGMLGNTNALSGKGIYDALEEVVGTGMVNEVLAAAGFDGVTHIGGQVGGGRKHRVWIAFEPTQVKSTSNVGTFDPADPDLYKAVVLAPGSRGGRYRITPKGQIRYDEAPTPQTERETAFQRWFGDSKVVTMMGDPQRVYHATNADFTAFVRQPNRHPDVLDEIGWWFADTQTLVNEVANFYGRRREGAQRIIPAYLSIQNPLRIETRNDFEGDVLYTAAYDPKRSASRNDEERVNLTMMLHADPERAATVIREALQRKGYDGLLIEKDLAGGAWVAFEPTQIKSAFNRGSYDPAEPDIAKAVEPPADPTALARLPADVQAWVILEYGLANPRAQRDPRLRAAMIHAEEHLSGHGDLVLAKASWEQLGLFSERKPVLAPGSRGGKYRITPKGDVRYDEAPIPEPVRAKGKPEPAEHLKDIIARVPAFSGGVTTAPGDKRPLPASPFVISYGGGWDSTAIIIECWKRGIRPDAITFADTGGEAPETYTFVWRFNQWLLDHDMPPITVVRATPVKPTYTTLEGNSIENQTVPGILLGRKNCSIKWKQEPQWAWLREQPFALTSWKAKRPVLRAIGYEAGEEYRSNKQGAMLSAAGEAKWYPLQEWGITREGCGRIIVEAGLSLWPAPGGCKKSACFFCPASKQAEILELAQNHPDLAARAIAIEDTARSGRHPLRAFQGLSWGEVSRKNPTGWTGSWRELVGDMPAVAAELAKIDPEKRFGEVIQFGSGASSPSQWQAFVNTKTPVGIDIMQASPDLWRSIAEYADSGGRIFIDSGAFGDFRAGRTTDWPEVMGRYRDLLDTVATTGNDQKIAWRLRHLYMVMPDIIGDQEGTLALQDFFAKQIRDWSRGNLGEWLKGGKPGNGIRALVPIQLGKLPPSECYRRIVAMLTPKGATMPNEDFAVLVPSNEKAFSKADLAELLTAKPKAIHLAGIAANPKVVELVAMIRAAAPYCAITTDGNRIPAWAAKGRPLTTALHARKPTDEARVREGVEGGMLNDPLLWTYAHAERFRKELQLTRVERDELANAMGGGTIGLGKYLDHLRDLKGHNAVRGALYHAFREDLQTGPEAQTEELGRLLAERGVGPKGVKLRATWPTGQGPLAKAVRLAGIDNALLGLLREREAIHLDLWYVREEDLPSSKGTFRYELERRKRELEARLARIDYEIDKRRLP